GGGLGQAFEEEGHRHTERFGDVPQTRGTDPVHAGLVLLDLLELDADTLGELLLRHTHHPAAMTDALADVDVHWMLHHSLPFTTTETVYAINRRGWRNLSKRIAPMLRN